MDHAKLDLLIAEAEAAFKLLSPAERQKMCDAQRASWFSAESELAKDPRTR
jgi:hypothetical protein